MIPAGTCKYTGCALATYSPEKRAELMARNAAAIAWLEGVERSCHKEFQRLRKQIHDRKQQQEFLDKNNPTLVSIIQVNERSCGRPEPVYCGIMAFPVCQFVDENGLVDEEIKQKGV